MYVVHIHLDMQQFPFVLIAREKTLDVMVEGILLRMTDVRITVPDEVMVP
jgi:hypothetical protein